MNSADSQRPIVRLLRGLARKTGKVVADWRYAQRRVIELRTAPDFYMMTPDAPPDTYREFLYRTSGVLKHEPPARKRTRGVPHPR